MAPEDVKTEGNPTDSCCGFSFEMAGFPDFRFFCMLEKKGEEWGRKRPEFLDHRGGMGERCPLCGGAGRGACEYRLPDEFIAALAAFAVRHFNALRLRKSLKKKKPAQ